MRSPENRLLPWLIAATVLVNGAAGWWFAQQRALRLAVPSPVTAPGPPVPSLTLVSERKPPPPEISPQPPVTGNTESAQPAPPEAVAANPQVSPGAQPEVAAAVADAPDEPMGPPAPEATADAPSPEPPHPPAPEPKPEPARKSAAPHSRCALIGPAIGSAEINRWRDAIQGPDVTVSSTLALDEPFVTGYRVIVSAPSPGSALARLAADGFEGFVVGRDGRGVRISLGVFEVRANAERQFAQLRDHGYAVDIQPQQEMRKTFWLRAQVAADGAPRVRAILKARFPDASPVWRDCPAGG